LKVRSTISVFVYSEIAKMKYTLEEYEAAVQDFKAALSGSDSGASRTDPDSASQDRRAELKSEIETLETEVALTQAKRAVVRTAVGRLRFSDSWWRDHSARMWRHSKSTEVLSACQQRTQTVQERVGWTRLSRLDSASVA
jgi:hypothetical protein